MRSTIACLILATVVVCLVIYWAREQEATYALPLIKVSEPASVVPWRLLTLCPVNSSNIPHYKDRNA
jgi:hypothetical protein